MPIFKLNIIFILAALTELSLSQTTIDTAYFDNNWKIIEKSDTFSFFRLIKIDPSVNNLFLVEDHFATGEIQMKGYYKSISPDNKHGEFMYYNKEGRKIQECKYYNNNLDGLFQSWHPDGQLSNKCRYNNGKLTGEYQEWYSNGNPRMLIDFDNGKRSGRFITYYENGNPVRKDFYSDDELRQKQCFTAEGLEAEYFPYMEDASYKGGAAMFRKYIRENLAGASYPESERKLDGEVLVSFEVMQDGKIGNIEVIRSTNDKLNEHALRIIRNSPDWNPARIDGKPTMMIYRLVIEF